MADDPSARVRFQVAFTLGELGGDVALRGLAAIARRDAADLWVRTAILSSAMADPGGLFERLWQDRAFAASAGGIALLRPLALVVGVRNRPGEPGRILAAIGVGRTEDAEAIRAVMLGLGDGLARAGRRLSDVKAELSPAAAAWLERQLADAAVLAADRSGKPERRAEAVALLGHGDFDRVKELLRLLLVPIEPPEVQSGGRHGHSGLRPARGARNPLEPVEGLFAGTTCQGRRASAGTTRLDCRRA